MTVRAEKFMATIYQREKPDDALMPGEGIDIEVVRYHKAHSRRCPTCDALVARAMSPESAARIGKRQKGE